MSKWLVITIIAALVAVVAPPPEAKALGLKIAPLQYKTSLKKNERKQGFIDVSNPSGQTIQVAVSTQAFKQINNDGGLQFYDDKQISAGIVPELRSFELGPRQALRLYFSILSQNLPKGDVYGALFFSTQPKQPISGVGQLVRVGTLLSIVNESSGPRSAEITALRIAGLQLSNTVSGSYVVKNTGKADSGFYPQVRVSSWPAKAVKTIESPLVFGGRQREADFTYDLGLGIHKLNVSYGSSTKSAYILTLTPWLIIVLCIVVLLVGTEIILYLRRNKTA